MASVINSNRPDQPLPQCRWLVDLTTANANVSTPILYNELLLSLSYGGVLTGVWSDDEPEGPAGAEGVQPSIGRLRVGC